MNKLPLWIFYILIARIELVECLHKKWLPDANFGNPRNWDTGRAPCGNDRVVVPDEGPVVYFQMNTTIQELILPMDSEIVFAPWSTLAFTSDGDGTSKCQSSSEVHFNVTYPPDWMDFRNWCSMKDVNGECENLNVLDSEMVPCLNDDVIFPTRATYFVNLESNLEIKINSLKFDGRSYTSSKFESFLNTTYGTKMFPVPHGESSRSSVKITGRKCADPSGCTCGNDDGKVLDSICKYRVPYCPKVRCSQPIKASGGCCEMCGAILTVEYRTGFRFNELKDGLFNTYLNGKSQYNNVQYIVSKMSNNDIQIVLSDTNGNVGVQVGTSMKKELDADIKGGFRYSIKSVMMISSSGNGQPSGRHGGTSLPSGEIAAIVLSVLVVVAVSSLFAVFMYRKKRSGDEIGFKLFNHIKFRSTTRKPRMEVPPSFVFRVGGSGMEVPEYIGASSSQGFDNPMYGTQPMNKPMVFEMKPSEFLPEEEQPTPFDNNLGFDNPLYENLQESRFSDPTKVHDRRSDIEEEDKDKI